MRTGAPRAPGAGERARATQERRHRDAQRPVRGLVAPRKQQNAHQSHHDVRQPRREPRRDQASFRERRPEIHRDVVGEDDAPDRSRSCPGRRRGGWWRRGRCRSDPKTRQATGIDHLRWMVMSSVCGDSPRAFAATAARSSSIVISLRAAIRRCREDRTRIERQDETIELEHLVGAAWCSRCAARPPPAPVRSNAVSWLMATRP